jgi:hypothetical protein
MNTIKIKGHTFRYNVRRWFDGRWYGKTTFYTEEIHYKFLWWKWSEPVVLFSVNIDIEDPQHSSEEVREIILRKFSEFEKWEKRKQEINSNKII